MAVDKFIPEIWAAAVMGNFAESEVIAPTVSRDYEGEAQKGNAVRITSFSRPGIRDYAEGEDGSSRLISPEALDDESQTIMINQEKAFSFYIDDIDERQAAGTFEPVVADAAAGLVETAETFIAEQMIADGTTISGTVDSGDTAFNLIRDMRTQLSAEPVKAPLGDRYLLVNPEFSNHLLGADSKLVEVDTSGDAKGLRDATLGRLLGFTVVESSLLNPGTPTAVAYHSSAVGHVAQIDQVEALRAERRFSDIFRALKVYGTKVTRPEACLVWVDGNGS